LPDIFLSYSREDQAAARRFAEAFQQAGLSVWWDQTLSVGEAYDEVTEKALLEAKAVVVLWSRTSVASRWVRAEATQANDNKTLVPVMIEACKRPIMFELTHTAELAHWKGNTQDPAWQSFLADLMRFVRREAPAPGPRSPIALPAKRPGRRAMLMVIAAVVILGAGAAWWLPRRNHGQTTSSVGAQEVTLAVLPFANLSSDPEQEYFSDGLTEEILNQLAQVRNLAVTGRTSSFSFKGKNEDLRVIARTLGVANLLEGSVRKDGRKLRITAQLINGRDGAHQWSKTYDRELSDVFALQEEVAKDVAQALSIKLDVGEMSRAQGGTTNLEAYEKYLHATDALRRIDFAAALPLFRAAVALDPDFGLAWVGLYKSIPPAASAAPQEAAALLKERRTVVAAKLKSLPLDPHTRLSLEANEYRESHQWAAAVAAGRALEASTPSNSDFHNLYALILWSVGQVREAAVFMQRYEDSDPLAAVEWLVEIYSSIGSRTDARRELNRVMKIMAPQAAGAGPIFDLQAWLADALLDGPVDGAKLKATLRAHPLPQDGSPTSKLIAALAVAPNEADMRRQLHIAFNDAAFQTEGALGLIFALADVCGDRQLMLDALARNYIDLKSGFVPSIWAATQTPIRNDPAFKDILRKLGLVDYWRTSGNWGDFCKPAGADDFECH
jgi:TolB-like protein